MAADEAVVEAELAQGYRVAEKRFLALVDDVRLNQLDVQVFTKYFIRTKSRQRLEHLHIIINALESHRLATLRILKVIQEREAIVAAILDKAREFAAKKITTLEAQTSVLQQLYKHQQVSLKIIEGIHGWREGLTRPFPFQFKGKNYLRKILQDCEYIDGCQLKAVLPLRVAQFPLCSNIPALKMFSEAKGASNSATTSNVASKKGEPSLSPRNTLLRKPAADGDGNTNTDYSNRLRAAESVLFAERTLQLKVMRELASLANNKQFVTLLNVVEVVPNCSTGILITDPLWEGQLREWIGRALRKAEEDSETTVASPSPSPTKRTKSPQASPSKLSPRRPETPPSVTRRRSSSSSSSASSKRSQSRDPPESRPNPTPRTTSGPPVANAGAAEATGAAIPALQSSYQSSQGPGDEPQNPSKYEDEFEDEEDEG